MTEHRNAAPTDTEALHDLEWLIVEERAEVSWGIAKGCRCMSCSVYQIRIDDDTYEGETLKEAIAEAIKAVRKG